MKPESREYGVSGRAEFCSTLAHQPVHLLAPKAMNRKQSPWILGARSETGFVRSSNEDRMGWIRTAYGDAFVVSDGMGGYRGGALAAEITVRSLQEHLALITPQSAHFADGIRQAFLNANREVFSQRDPEDPETRDMGATGVALVTSGSRAMIAHVGDSRAYLWRPDTGLRLLTNDHTRVQSMLEAGLLTPAQAAVHPDASVLDRAIGHQPTVQVDVSDWIDLKNGDMLLLCSDGLSGYVSDSEIESILRTDGGVQNTTDRLIECALSKGGADNVTVQLVRFVPRQDISFARLAKSPIVLVPVCIGLSTIALLLMYTQLTKSEQHKTAVLQKQLEQSRLEVASLNKDLAARKAPTPPAAAPKSSPRAEVPAASTQPPSRTKANHTSQSAVKAHKKKTTSPMPPNEKQIRPHTPLAQPPAGTEALPPSTTGGTRPSNEKESTLPVGTSGPSSAPSAPNMSGSP